MTTVSPKGYLLHLFFKDLDPDQTMRTLYECFLPVAYKPGYWASLTDEE